MLILIIAVVIDLGGIGGGEYIVRAFSLAETDGYHNSRDKNLPNFGEATTTLYHGGQPSKDEFRMLAKMGVNIVVDLRGSRN